MKQLKLKNYFLFQNAAEPFDPLHVWLSNQMLHGKESRSRTRFISLISDRIKEIESERQRMLEDVAEKRTIKEKVKDKKTGKEKIEKVEKFVYWKRPDKPGDPLEEETMNPQEAARYKISPENLKKFEKEFSDYLKEELIIDVTPANNETVYITRDILLNTKEEFGGRQAVLYDEWCEAFENISESNKAKKKKK